MMHEANDRRNAERLEFGEPRIVPCPFARVRPVRCDRLPKSRIAQRSDAEIRDDVEVGVTLIVPGFFYLITVHVADSRHRALDAAPELKAIRRGSRAWHDAQGRTVDVRGRRSGDDASTLWRRHTSSTSRRIVGLHADDVTISQSK